MICANVVLCFCFWVWVDNDMMVLLDGCMCRLVLLFIDSLRMFMCLCGLVPMFLVKNDTLMFISLLCARFLVCLRCRFL